VIIYHNSFRIKNLFKHTNSLVQPQTACLNLTNKLNSYLLRLLTIFFYSFILCTTLRVRDPMRWVIFLIYLIFPAALGLEVYSASNRNEYQTQKKKCFWGLECDRCRRLTTLSPSVSRWSRQCGILNISQPYRPPWPVTGIALLYGDGVRFLWGTDWTVSTATSSQYLAVNCEPTV
jgi:hypothetical protein